MGRNTQGQSRSRSRSTGPRPGTGSGNRGWGNMQGPNNRANKSAMRGVNYLACDAAINAAISSADNTEVTLENYMRLPDLQINLTNNVGAMSSKLRTVLLGAGNSKVAVYEMGTWKVMTFELTAATSAPTLNEGETKGFWMGTDRTHYYATKSGVDCSGLIAGGYCYKQWPEAKEQDSPAPSLSAMSSSATTTTTATARSPSPKAGAKLATSLKIAGNTAQAQSAASVDGATGPSKLLKLLVFSPYVLDDRGQPSSTSTQAMDESRGATSIKDAVLDIQALCEYTPLSTPFSIAPYVQRAPGAVATMSLLVPMAIAATQANVVALAHGARRLDPNMLAGLAFAYAAAPSSLIEVPDLNANMSLRMFRGALGMITVQTLAVWAGYALSKGAVIATTAGARRQHTGITLDKMVADLEKSDPSA
jgi:hypothetical protein